MNKIIQKLNSFYNKKPRLAIGLFALLFATITVLIASETASFIYKMAPGNDYNHDEGMFYYMGQLMSKGYEPYTDFFDHKGLYLFYYVTIGIAVGGRWGLLAVQIITYTIFFFIFIKMLLLYGFNKKNILWSVTVMSAVLIICGQSPSDFEILLPFIAASLYFYIKAIKTEDDKYYYFGNILTGVTAGVAINIRASDAMVPFAMVIFYAVNQFRKKKFLSVLYNALICVGSLVLACLPAFIHSYVCGFTSLMYETIILNNFKYVSSTNGIDQHKIISQGLILAITALVVVFTILLRKKLNKDEIYFYLINTGVMMALQFIIAYYPHYLMICVPFFVLFAGRVASLMNLNKPVKYAFGGFTLLTFIGSIAFFPIRYYGDQYQKDVAINEYINSVITTQDKNGHVLCYSCSSSYYINNDIWASYPDFGCQENHIQISKTYDLNRLIEYVSSEQCHYLIIENREFVDPFYDWLVDTAIPNGIYKECESSLKGREYIIIYERV